MSKFWKTDSDSSTSSSDGVDESNVKKITPKTEEVGPKSENDKCSQADVLSMDPDETWRLIEKDQAFEDILYRTKNDDTECVRLVCFSDTHGKHREVVLPPGDILLHGGDFSKSGEVGSIQDMNSYFKESGFSEIILIAGNHDMTLQPDWYSDNWERFHRKPFDVDEAQKALKNCIYLQDSTYVTSKGDFEVYGSPWSPFFFDWAFNEQRGQALREIWKKIPTSTDILITHGPPLGRGDLASSEVRAGCYDLLIAVQERVKPRVHIFGHIHEGAGISFDGQTLYINASSLNLGYQSVNFPVVVDLPKDITKRARVVLPSCTVSGREFVGWCKGKGFNLLVEHLGGERLASLPSGNDFFSEDAYETIVNELRLHRDRRACSELRKALAYLYAESF